MKDWISKIVYYTDESIVLMSISNRPLFSAITRKLPVHCSQFTVHFKWLVSFLFCGPVSLVAFWFITMKNNFDFLLTCNPLVMNYNKLFWVLYVLLYTWLFCVANNLLYILKYWVFSLFMAVCTFYLKANGDNNTVSG